MFTSNVDDMRESQIRYYFSISCLLAFAQVELVFYNERWIYSDFFMITSNGKFFGSAHKWQNLLETIIS